MNIISYRGPGMAGGVSAALARLWDSHGSNDSWWYVKDTALNVAGGLDLCAKPLAYLSPKLIEGHYRFCHEFLWPVLHDLSELAVFNQADHEHYLRFNELLSRLTAYSSSSSIGSCYFVQDYQLALMPHLLRRFGINHTMIFMHVPWPKNVSSEHVPTLLPIVKGMLAADMVGFHVAEYGRNFLEFVRRHLPEYSCDFARMKVSPADEAIAAFRPTHFLGREKARANVRSTEIVIAPLGLDYDHWHTLANNARATIWQPSLAKKQYVLSVDRADYTKGIAHRIKAIDAFFEKYPNFRGEVVFAQVCGRTRSGISAYDAYWDECRHLEAQLKDRWQTGQWQPLLWFEKPFTAPQLSLLYRNAAAMVVNPVRDGLNLTAKEYVACQGQKPGVLALSKGAGAWHEMGDKSLEVNPLDPAQMADAIHRALVMTPEEKSARMEVLLKRVKQNTLERWWERFNVSIAAKQATGSKVSQLREIS
jgi:trehalose-6-phosphate synthase